MTNVLLVEDHAAFRQALALVCEKEQDITVIGQAGTVREAERLLPSADVLVLDLNLPDGSGVDLIEKFQKVKTAGRVLVVTGRSAIEAARAVEAGADGVLSKSDSLECLIESIRKLGSGEQLLTARETAELLRLATRQRRLKGDSVGKTASLTDRETEVLQALTDGLSDRDMAEHLHISTDTARKHVANILGKLGVESRLQAVLFALRNGVTELH